MTFDNPDEDRIDLHRRAVAQQNEIYREIGDKFSPSRAIKTGPIHNAQSTVEVSAGELAWRICMTVSPGRERRAALTKIE